VSARPRATNVLHTHTTVTQHSCNQETQPPLPSGRQTTTRRSSQDMKR